MISWRTEDFKKGFAKLPPDVQDLTDATYEIWKASPFHSSLHFKHLSDDVWSVRIGRGHRALGLKSDNEIFWFWIGSHADYDVLYGNTKALKKGQQMQKQQSKPEKTSTSKKKPSKSTKSKKA